jgi:hypothetical protein
MISLAGVGAVVGFRCDLMFMVCTNDAAGTSLGSRLSWVYAMLLC